MHVYKWTVRTEYIITRINVLGKDVAAKACKNTYLIITASLIISCKGWWKVANLLKQYRWKDLHKDFHNSTLTWIYLK